MLNPVSDVQSWVNEGRRKVSYITRCLSGVLSSPGVFQAVNGQETYPYSGCTTLLQSTFPGAGAVIDVTGISVAWGTFVPALEFTPWLEFQAYYRAVNVIVSSYPLRWSMDRDGVSGQAWLWPIPSVTTDMQWRVHYTPADLTSDASPDILPDPFTDAVKYWAAYVGFLATGRNGLALLYRDLFADQLGIDRSGTYRGRPGRWY